jgi:fructose-bisphosphate aldolase class I
MESNANDLARYAALCQEANLVPIVEPEVLMEGAHSLEQCSAVTEDLLHCVFDEIYAQGVLLEGMILKPNMVLPGLDCPTRSGINEVADTTITCLLQIVPAAVSGIAFLSGGQSPEAATAHLNAMNTRFIARLPWPVTFSFARAIQQPVLQRWAGLEAKAGTPQLARTKAYTDDMEVTTLEVNTAAAQQVLYHRAKCNQAAIRGEYHPSIESP